MSTGNDNDKLPANAIPFAELAVAMQLDEDVLLRRLAKILRKREIKSCKPKPK